MTFVLTLLALLACLTQPAMAHNQSHLVLEPSQNDDQTKMLLLISSWTPKDPSWTNQTPACQWAGVNCTNGYVTGLDWDNRGLRGFFNGSNLPTGLQYGYFNNNLYYHGFTGTPILNSLPAGLQTLDIRNNYFCGSSVVDISCQHVYVDGTCNNSTHTVTFDQACDTMP